MQFAEKQDISVVTHEISAKDSMGPGLRCVIFSQKQPLFLLLGDNCVDKEEFQGSWLAGQNRAAARESYRGWGRSLLIQ